MSGTVSLAHKFVDIIDELCDFAIYRKTVVVGSGYIAVELAGILNALGSDVSLIIRRGKVWAQT